MSVIQRIRNVRGQKTRDAHFTAKFEWQGKTVWRKLDTTDRAKAESLERAIKKELQSGRLPDLLDQVRARADRTTAHLISDYLAAHCPDAAMNPRTGAALAREQAAVAIARQWWDAHHPDKINAGHSLAYVRWRRTTLTRKNCTGNRTAELELQSVANMFAWAHAAGHLAHRPHIQLRFRDPKTIRHAREGMPADAAELHATAAWFFRPRAYPPSTDPERAPDHRKQVFGWLKLFLPITGLRIGEARLLLARAKLLPGHPQPGYADDTYLYVHREKRGCNPRIRLDDPDRPWIRPLLEMIRAWHAAYYPHSLWLFPGRAGAQLDKHAYGKALDQATTALNLPKRWPHGDRAYYTSARLAQGVDIDAVARELGQRSGEDLVRDVYGLDLDTFSADTFKSLKDTLTWLPAAGAEPAWAWWNQSASNIIALPAQ
jgi:hypothetical protein